MAIRRGECCGNSRRLAKRKEESDGESLQTPKAGANGTTPQKPELHGTIEEAVNREAEEILYPISFQQAPSGCLLKIETDVPIHARMRAGRDREAGAEGDDWTEIVTGGSEEVVGQVQPPNSA